MSDRISDRLGMIAGMKPMLRPGTFAFITVDPETPPPAGTIASFVEDEGLSLIVPLAAAPDTDLLMRCITLQVHSSLEGVGLTAAVSGALADAGIPANMVAANHHDHVFVPADVAEQALDVLIALQRSAQTA